MTTLNQPGIALSIWDSSWRIARSPNHPSRQLPFLQATSGSELHSPAVEGPNVSVLARCGVTGTLIARRRLHLGD